MVPVQSVAAALVARLGPVTAMQLQKLVYYCQAWHLAKYDAPLFEQDIQAWVDGPVVYDLFREHRGKVAVSETKGDPNALDPEAAGIVDFVSEVYGTLPVRELVDATHIEAPYTLARRGLAPTTPSRNIISRADMTKYYRRLMADPDTAVQHAVHSAALEGIDTDFEDYLRLVDVADGTLDEETAVAQLVETWSARGPG